EVLDPIAIHPENADELLLLHAGQPDVVAGVLHHDLARPPRGDPVVHSHAFPDQLLLDDEVRVAFRDHADLPPGPVRRAPLRAVGRDLGRGETLLARAEGTDPGRPLPWPNPPPPDQHPLTGDRVLAQLSLHRGSFSAYREGPAGVAWPRNANDA